MAFSGGDKTWIVYQGPPRWDGSRWINGDRFFLSGHRAMQGKEGVELSSGVSGLELPTSEHRFDQSANTPGASLIDTIDGRRNIKASINILGDTPAEVRNNKRRWLEAHPSKEPGKLWFFTSDAMPRYLLSVRSEDAGLITLNKDPSIRRIYEDVEWGWVSDDAYFRGYKETKELKVLPGNNFGRTFYNTSTAEEIYPVLYLPGGTNVRWEVSLGYERDNYITPTLAANEEGRLDFNPANPTFYKRNLDTGVLTNLWPSMVGERPHFSLEPQTMNTYTVRLLAGTVPTFRTKPRLVFTPLFTSWN